MGGERKKESNHQATAEKGGRVCVLEACARSRIQQKVALLLTRLLHSARSFTPPPPPAASVSAPPRCSGRRRPVPPKPRPAVHAREPCHVLYARIAVHHRGNKDASRSLKKPHPPNQNDAPTLRSAQKKSYAFSFRGIASRRGPSSNPSKPKVMRPASHAYCPTTLVHVRRLVVDFEQKGKREGRCGDIHARLIWVGVGVHRLNPINACCRVFKDVTLRTFPGALTPPPCYRSGWSGPRRLWSQSRRWPRACTRLCVFETETTLVGVAVYSPHSPFCSAQSQSLVPQKQTQSEEAASPAGIARTLEDG